MRTGSGTALSDKIKYLGVFCGKRAAGTQAAGRNRSCGQRERDARSARLTEEGPPAADPTNLEPRLGEMSQRNLAVARRLVSLATGAKE